MRAGESRIALALSAGRHFPPQLLTPQQTVRRQTGAERSRKHEDGWGFLRALAAVGSAQPFLPSTRCRLGETGDTSANQRSALILAFEDSTAGKPIRRGGERSFKRSCCH